MEPKQLLGDEPLSEFVSYAIPGLIYFINNNCLFFILQEVDPTTFQLLSQMKTIFTGLLFRVFLNRQITPVQSCRPPFALSHNQHCPFVRTVSRPGDSRMWHSVFAAAIRAGMPLFVTCDLDDKPL
eukprot:scaffold129596_cov33-Tisochrysis_lutea.AAC.4